MKPLRVGFQRDARNDELFAAALRILEQSIPGMDVEPIVLADKTMTQIEGLLNEGSIDCAVVMVLVNVPEHLPDGVDWFRLPCASNQGAENVGIHITFNRLNHKMVRFRSLFIRAVSFVGAGAGQADLCTLAGVQVLKRCQACLYDSLIDPSLLDFLKDGAIRMDVGKRNGRSVGQSKINKLLSDLARQGLRVVRLKGGDPGVFGHLADELQAMERLHLPYRIIPGVSSLFTAATANGFLLTKRSVSRGFSVFSARDHRGNLCELGTQARLGVPAVYFMGIQVLPELASRLVNEGQGAETPVAIVLDAGGLSEQIIQTNLGDLCSGACSIEEDGHPRPGLVIVGEAARYRYTRRDGALQGKRFLLMANARKAAELKSATRDFGGEAFVWAADDGRDIGVPRTIPTFDAVICDDPEAFRRFNDEFGDAALDEKKIFTTSENLRTELKGKGVACVVFGEGCRPEEIIQEIAVQIVTGDLDKIDNGSLPNYLE